MKTEGLEGGGRTACEVGGARAETGRLKCDERVRRWRCRQGSENLSVWSSVSTLTVR